MGSSSSGRDECFGGNSGVSGVVAARVVLTRLVRVHELYLVRERAPLAVRGPEEKLLERRKLQIVEHSQVPATLEAHERHRRHETSWGWEQRGPPRLCVESRVERVVSEMNVETRA